jgi:TPR repeat protein
MRFLAAITLLFLALAITQPVAAQGFKPDWWAGENAWERANFATALRHWRPLAEQGDARAQWSLGLMYHYGDGVTKDLKEAVRWYRKAAEGNIRSCQTNANQSLYGMNVVGLCSTKLTPLGESSVALKFEIMT